MTTPTDNDATAAEVARLRSETRDLRDASIKAALAQAAEIGTLLGRLSKEEAKAAELTMNVADLNEQLAQARAAELSHGSVASQARAELMSAQAELARLRSRSARNDFGPNLKQVIQRFKSEIEQLRQEVIALEAVNDPRRLRDLEHIQLKILSSLRRPEPIAPLPAELDPDSQAKYLAIYSSLLFDAEWYLASNPDVASLGLDPALHYLKYGWLEGRQPGPAFNGDDYLAVNPDLAAAGINPLAHYLLLGAHENRQVATVKWGKPLPIGEDDDLEGRSQPTYWFFVGDTMDWLAHHRHLTGVGRVTTELLFASISDPGSPTGLCLRGASPSGLVRLEDMSLVDKLLDRTHLGKDGEISTKGAHVSRSYPREGDHVFFSGVVWTEPYAMLFRQLAARKVTFSVLIHDIIPAIEPEIADEASSRSFAQWLKATLLTASVIYVSNDAVANDVRRWSICAGLPHHDHLKRIEFGTRTLPLPATSSTLPDGIASDGFVLCVGTIDLRKNQSVLIDLWGRLIIDIGLVATPQLVLVGRDDAKVATSATARALIAQTKLLILEDADDLTVAALYRACLFTIFPSKSEGYGLPVAESLAYGKPCLASDLPAIRAHAGNAVHYIDPDDSEATLNAIKRALEKPAWLAAQLAEYRPADWQQTFRAMRNAAGEALIDRPEGRHLPTSDRYAGTVSETPLEIFRKAALWCSNDSPEVSIVIINWNAASLTLDCIRQIWAKTEGVRYEIIIADNGSSERDCSMLRDLGAGVRIIEIGCNRFFGEANNIAVEAANGDYVCLLNNDAFVESGWIEALITPLRNRHDVGATGPLFLFPDGTVQEAGGTVDKKGYPLRSGRGSASLSVDLVEPRVVDYISAATFMMSKSLFTNIGGFDLQFEPAYYEDTDLCFKVKASGKDVLYCPSAKVIHIEGSASNGSPDAELHRRNIGDLNREKFIARWGDYLIERDPSALEPVRVALKIGDEAVEPISSAPPAQAKTRPRAVIYTPYALTPGGGERYILTAASALSDTHAVTLVTEHPYSRLRLRGLGIELGIDLSRVDLISDSTLASVGTPDLQIVMGNHVVPPIAGCGRRNLFHCQFPFPMTHAATSEDRALLRSYDHFIVNSEYTAMHVRAALNGYQLPDLPIKVIAPPVTMFSPGNKRKNNILSVGRFFLGGHSKRHDLLINAFKALINQHRGDMTLHIAGSSNPEPRHISYLASLMDAARGYPIHFHVNASPPELAHLYGSADIYWHGTGLGTELAQHPAAAEHFGIAIVEAMSAGAIPLALASGGAREIIEHGVSGFLYESSDRLVEMTSRLIAMPSTLRDDIARACHARAKDFTSEKFADRLLAMIEDRVG